MKCEAHRLTTVALLAICAVVFLLRPHGVSAEESQTAKEAGTTVEATTEVSDLPYAEKIGPHTYRIGGLLVNDASMEIRLEAHVNMTKGLVEVMLSTEYGKVHESLLTTQSRPKDLHAALLLLSLRPGSNPGWLIPEEPDLRPPSWEEPPGDEVDITVSWKTKDGPVLFRLEELLVDIRDGKSPPRTGWVFIGSGIVPSGDYLADQTGSIVTNYHDFSAVIDCPLELGQVDDYCYANESCLPKAGTPVDIRVTVAEDGSKDGTRKGSQDDQPE